MLSIRERRDGDIVVVEVGGEVDAASAHLMRDALVLAFADGITRIVADLTEVTFIDSSGLGVLVGQFKEARLRGDSLRLHVVATNERVMKIFSVTGLDTVFPIHGTAAQAMSALA